MNALTLGYALGVDALVMPPAWSRSPGDFNHSKFDQQWVKDNPVNALLDLQAMAAGWAQRGIRLLEVSVGHKQGCLRASRAQCRKCQSPFTSKCVMLGPLK